MHHMGNSEFGESPNSKRRGDRSRTASRIRRQERNPSRKRKPAHFSVRTSRVGGPLAEIRRSGFQGPMSRLVGVKQKVRVRTAPGFHAHSY